MFLNRIYDLCDLNINILGSERVSGNSEIHLVPRVGDLWVGHIWPPAGVEGDVGCEVEQEQDHHLRARSQDHHLLSDGL